MTHPTPEDIEGALEWVEQCIKNLEALDPKTHPVFAFNQRDKMLPKYKAIRFCLAFTKEAMSVRPMYDDKDEAMYLYCKLGNADARTFRRIVNTIIEKVK